MGSLWTRGDLRHSYQAGGGPARVTVNAITATAQTPAGPVLVPLSAPVATIAADGAPFYNTGYDPHRPSRPSPGTQVTELRLPPRAAQLDLTDMSSWDRPVQFTGVA